MKLETLQNEQTNQTNVPKQLGNRQTKENTACVFQNCKTAVLWSGVNVSLTLLGEVWRAALHVVTGLMWLEKWSLSFVYLTDHSSGIFCWWMCQRSFGRGWSSACESAGQFQWLFHRVLQHLLLRVYWFYSTSHPCGSHRHPDPKTNLPEGHECKHTQEGPEKAWKAKTGICWRLVQHGFAPWAAPISTF